MTVAKDLEILKEKQEMKEGKTFQNIKASKYPRR